MEPMDPNQRRIIHSAIGKMEGCAQREQRGEGRDRRVSSTPLLPMPRPDNTYGERRPRGNGRRPGGPAMAASAVDAAAAPGMAVPAMAAPQAAAVPVLPACPSAPMLPVTQKLPHLRHPSERARG